MTALSDRGPVGSAGGPRWRSPGDLRILLGLLFTFDRPFLVAGGLLLVLDGPFLVANRRLLVFDGCLPRPSVSFWRASARLHCVKANVPRMPTTNRATIEAARAARRLRIRTDGALGPAEGQGGGGPLVQGLQAFHQLRCARQPGGWIAVHALANVVRQQPQCQFAGGVERTGGE